MRLYGDTVHYTPTAGFSGNDSFNYTVTDLSGAPIRAIVSVTVRPNQPPVANDDVVTTGQDTPVTFNVLANDTDPEGNTLKVDGVTSPPAHGIVVVQTLTGEATYTPSSGYFGPDAFTYSISDGHGGTASGVVHITVTPANQPPSGCVAGIVPPECTLAGAGGTPLVLSLNGTDGCVVLRGSASDPDGQALQYSWSANGTVFGTGAEVRNCFPVGCHTVTFTATDPMGASCSATVSFCVINPGEAVEQTVALVESTEVDRKNKRPLIASLKAAGASFDRGSFESGLNQLHAFQNKVRAQIAGANPAAAQALADSVQGIIDAVACSALVATQP